MKRVFINSFGGPDVASIGDAGVREPQADEAIVRVEAASVNPLDLKIIAGTVRQFFPVEFPYVPGCDFSGIVEAVGGLVENLKAGDRVVGRTAPSAGGAYAIATSSARNIDLVKSLGADEVIDYRTQDFTQVRDIDLVLDIIGGETLEKSWSVLRTGGGRIVTL